jgi:hypothetical protein
MDYSSQTYRAAGDQRALEICKKKSSFAHCKNIAHELWETFPKCEKNQNHLMQRPEISNG